MDRDRNALLELVLNRYARWYNIEHTDSIPLVATATYHEETKGYILIKKAQTWTAARHEYTFFFSLPKLTAALFEECLQQAIASGNAQIHPDRGHMSSNIVAVFLTDETDADALKALKKCRIRISFHFSLYGWMEVQTAVIVTGKETVTANGAGWTTAKFLKNVLHPQVQHRFLKT